MNALRAAAVIHALHGIAATLLGLAGLLHGALEHHIPASDMQMFGVLFVVGPPFAAWLPLVVRHAAGPRRRAWLLPRAALAALLVLAYVIVGVFSALFVVSGGLLAGISIYAVIACVWLTVPEVLILSGTIAVFQGRPRQVVH